MFIACAHTIIIYLCGSVDCHYKIIYLMSPECYIDNGGKKWIRDENKRDNIQFQF